MIYADTSCLLKVLRPEPLSEAVWSAIDEEVSVIVSVLAELETLVQLKADWTGGMLSRNQWRQAETRFGILRNQPPFDYRALPAAVFQTALRQHRNSGDKHCRHWFRLSIPPVQSAFNCTNVSSSARTETMTEASSSIALQTDSLKGSGRSTLSRQLVSA